MRFKLLVLLTILWALQCKISSNHSRNQGPISPQLSKLDRIEGYARYEYEITLDPAIMEVPQERLISAKSIINKRYKGRAYLRNDDTWVSVGPGDVGGRTRAILVDANDASGNTVYAGSVSGGLYRTDRFKSDNPQFQPVEDIDENLAIGALLQDPSNPDIIYVGTGEGWFNGDASLGEGIYKTIDGGVSWDRLPSTINSKFWRVNDLEIDFNGNLYATTHNSGVQKSTDGGLTWRQVLGVSTGNSNSDRGADLEIGPDGDLYATTGLFSLGSVHKVDFQEHGDKAGDIETWIEITPDINFQRIEVAVAPTDEDRIYLLCEDEEDRTVSGMFRSNDGGITWDSITIPELTITFDSANFAREQAWYNLIAQVDPADEDVLYVGGIDLHRSTDAGNTWTALSNWYFSEPTGYVGDRVVHADQHEIQFVNGNSNQAIFTNDGGIYYSNNLMTTEPAFLPKDQGFNTTQFYSCCLSPITNDNLYAGGTQDNGTWLITSNELDPDFAFQIFGGDGGYCFWGQTKPNINAASFQYIAIFYSDNSGQSYNYITIEGSRGAFINPYTVDEKSEILYGAFENDQYFINRDPATQETIDSVQVPEFGGAQISAISIDPLVENRLWVGVRPYFEEEWMGNSGVYIIDDAHSDDPIITDISDPSWNQFLAPRNIYVDSMDPDFILVTFSNFGSPNVWITRDAGANWINIDGDLPDMPVRWGIINPLNPDEIIIATEYGVYSTVVINGSNTIWAPYKNGLPRLRYNMLKVRKSDNRLLAASFGRGLFTTTLQASVDAPVVASLGIESLVLNENEGFVFDSTSCGEPVRLFTIPIRLNRVLTDEEEVILSLGLVEGEEAQQNLVLSKQVRIPSDTLEFNMAGAFIDDPFREDRQELEIALLLDEGEASIDIGTLQLAINDDESNFITLSAETEPVILGRTLFRDVYTYFKTNQAVARILPISGNPNEPSCITVSIDGSGTEVVYPEWLFGSGYVAKTFFISSEMENGQYELELYFDPSEIGDLTAAFNDLNIIRSDLPISEIMDVTEIEVYEEVTPQMINANLYRVKFTTTELGGFALSNATGNTVNNESIAHQNIEIYPNPVRDVLQFDLPEQIESPYIRIYNQAGHLVYQADHFKPIKTSTWAPGMYVVDVGSLIREDKKSIKLIKLE